MLIAECLHKRLLGIRILDDDKTKDANTQIRKEEIFCSILRIAPFDLLSS